MKLFFAFALFVANVHVVDADPTQCNFCLEDDSATCSANQQSQTCATDQDSLGTTHCGSGVATYRKQLFKKEGVFRGCINCADKRTACFTVAGYLKVEKGVKLLECEIDCCTGRNCNTQTPTLSQAAIPVFSGGIGQVTCNSCMERDASTCSKTQTSQICALSSKSLGSSHCGSAVGKYRDEFGNFKEGFIRGCIECPDKKAACELLSGALKASYKWTLLECEIQCCKGNKCNTHVPALPAPTKAATKATAEALKAGQAVHHALFSGLLVPVATSVVNILYNIEKKSA